MTVNIENESNIKFDFSADDLVREVISYALDAKDFPYEAEVNVVLTGDEEIRAANREFRGIDRETDVLSFPALEYEAAGDFAFLDDLSEEEEAMYCDPDTGELVLGDMMVSLNRVKAQAAEYGHSEKRELAFLVAHSMLHLFGYDHMEEEERAVMQQEERSLMEGLGIFRDDRR
ncbi:MAG: rRNA maturation RNase YbeY [Lachnospiraceae bacterium]|nr:rRNA maturation RNase YbeY [Lachnospiraceae bacterium]